MPTKFTEFIDSDGPWKSNNSSVPDHMFFKIDVFWCKYMVISIEIFPVDHKLYDSYTVIEWGWG